ncbi:MAG: CDP-alcohol phosphatidyltransferase family protein [Planctomycetes bacterium]|nr:CDP-alcohol phosphatidyltransferase family protein [Planctomycetota bacterium]
MAIVGKFAENAPDRPRRRRLKSLAFLPALLTIGNLLCGFAAVHFALRAMHDLGAGISDDAVQIFQHPKWELILPSFLSVGAGLVLLGMVFDCFDGLVARATRSTTNFGGQLDSMADVVTFGVAPATLMIAFMTAELSGDSIVPSPLSQHALGRFTWIAAAIYVACGAIRLARYNVEHATAEFDHRMFRGLPIPGAAAIVVALIIVREHFGETGRLVTAYATPLVALAAALLMVSRIPYRRFHRAYLLGRKPFGQLVGFLIVFAVFWLYKAPTLLVVVLWYGASGPVELLVRRLRKQQPPATAERDRPSAGQRTA